MTNTLAVCLFACVAVALSAPLFDELIARATFEQFKLDHEKHYATPEEDDARFAIFAGHLQEIQDHNARHAAGEESYDMGVNKFTDLTFEEFEQQYTGVGQDEPNLAGSTFLEPENLVAPNTVDWRPKGYVTPVKDQGQCGSCWAFSATGSLEGQTFKKTGKLISLSEQNLVDCSRGQGNEGCRGGWMSYAFDYIKSNKGIDTEMSYPYEARDRSCRFKRENVGATLTGYTELPKGDEMKLKMATASVGPISFAFRVVSSFQHYRSGVYESRFCDGRVNHGMLIAGYGNMDNKDYWLVKNSWGTSWGNEGGYVYVVRGKNMCRIADYGIYPLV